MSSNLKNFVAIITGATKGIGLSVATMLAKQGAHIGALGRDFSDARKVWEHEKLDTIEPISADLIQPVDAGIKILNWLTTKGMKLDLLVNNAVFYGRNSRKPILQTSLQEWDQVFAINVRSAFVLSKMMIPSLVERNSLIINISSQISTQPAPGRASYGASKAALDSLTRSLAEELSGLAIAVIGIHPGGPVKTPGIISRRPVNFDYSGFLNSNVLDIPIQYLVTESKDRSKFSGHVLSALDFDNGWHL